MFQVARLTDPSLIRAFLTAKADDRARYAYMIGDLNAPYWDRAVFYGAFDRKQTLRSILLYYKITPRPTIISAGDADGIDACWATLLADFDLKTIVYHAQPTHMTAVKRYFSTPAPMAMWRMAITRERLNSAAIGKLAATRRLTGSDAEALQALFDSGAADDFMDGRPHVTPELLDDVQFSGAFAAGKLVAVAGTHIFSLPERLGTVGYVFTQPAVRGQGYAAGTTLAVTQMLFEAGLDLVVLNVKQSNTPAVRAYERVGYFRQSPLFEDIAHRLAMD